MLIYGYDATTWDMRTWLPDALARVNNPSGVLLLLGTETKWPSWSLAWVYKALRRVPQPAIIITDFGQFSPITWEGWNSMQTLLARAEVIGAAPFERWSDYAKVLGVSSILTDVGQWTPFYHETERNDLL